MPPKSAPSVKRSAHVWCQPTATAEPSGSEWNPSGSCTGGVAPRAAHTAPNTTKRRAAMALSKVPLEQVLGSIF